MMPTHDRCCGFCSKAFKRSDVLRRHYKRCPLRLGRPIPDRLQAGRRAKACDQCASLKVACDADYPCESCLSRGYVCSVNGQHRQSHHHQSNTSDIREARKAFVRQEDQQIDVHPYPTSKFTWLLNYLNPSTSSLESAFYIRPITDQHQTQCIRAGFLRSCEHLTTTLPPIPKPHRVSCDLDFGVSESSQLMNEDDVIDNLREEQDRILSERLSYENSHTSCADFLHDIPKSLQISLDYIGRGLIDELIHYSSKLTTREVPAKPSVSIRAACALLLGGKIPAFITNYFVRWNPHSPIVHRPSFRVAQVTPPLLLSILVTGGLLSSDPKIVSQVKSILGLVEQYTFDHEDFQYLLNHSKDYFAPFKPQYLGSIQAALTIFQTQLRYAPRDGRGILLYSRFNQLVDASRALGLHQRQHNHRALSQSPDEFEWNEFGVDEAAARLMCGIYNLDASFSIFLDVPPRLVFTNMALDVPCTAKAYMARDREECFQAIPQQNPMEKMRISNMLEVLYSEEAFELEHIREFNILHLFTLILAILQSMWLLERNQLQGHTETTVIRGLQRWKAVWDHQTTAESKISLDMYGFSKDAAIELWHLASFMVSKGYTKMSHVAQVQRTGPGGSIDPLAQCYNTLKQIAGFH